MNLKSFDIQYNVSIENNEELNKLMNIVVEKADNVKKAYEELKQAVFALNNTSIVLETGTDRVEAVEKEKPTKLDFLGYSSGCGIDSHYKCPKCGEQYNGWGLFYCGVKDNDIFRCTSCGALLIK